MPRGFLPRRRILALAGIALLLAAAAAGFFIYRHAPRQKVQTIAFSEFLHEVDAGQIASVTVRQNVLDLTRHGGVHVQTMAPAGYIAANPTFVPVLEQHHVTLDVAAAGGPAPYGYLAAFAIFAIFGALGFLVYRVTSGRVPSIEKRAGKLDPRAPVVTFADVAGVDEAKDELKGVVDFLRDPGRFAAVGGRVPKGVLLVGPPGTGKTLLARSIAGEAGVPFLFASGSDFVEMYAGVGAARIRKLFKDARRHPSCIVFIDELDAVGRSRGGHSLSHEEREQTLNQLLVEMDGFAPNIGIVVIAATNRQDILDQALLRPGRFDRQVHVGCPDVKGREAILRVHSRKIMLSQGVDLRAIARGTPGFSGAELANLVNEAALIAVQAGRHSVSDEDLDAARDKVMMGAERRSLAMTEHERITCAYHEAGHAVVASLLPEADPLHKVTIIPRGRALGVTMQLPEADRHTYSRAYLDGQLAILMGGRIAEEVFLEQMTSGAGNDIERATDIARRMVCDFGMSPLGPLAYKGQAGDPWQRESNAISAATAERVDAEVHALVMQGYRVARRLIERNREAVKRLAEELLVSESVDADGVRAILAGAMLEAAPTEAVH